MSLQVFDLNNVNYLPISPLFVYVYGCLQVVTSSLSCDFFIDETFFSLHEYYTFL